MAYIGIDLHSNRFTCTFLKDKEKKETVSYYLEEKDLKLFFSELKTNDFIALEASTNTFAFYDLIQDKVKQVFVVNPLEFSIINNTAKKTDKIDSVKLATMLKYHIEHDNNFLPLVYVPEHNIRKMRALFTSYKLYKKQTTAMKNRMHSILKQTLHPFNKKKLHTQMAKKIILNLGIEEEYKIQISLLLESIEYLNRKIKSIKNEIIYLAKNYEEETNILMSIHGVSLLSAIAVITDIADVKRFKNAKHFSSYLRSVPRVDSSNDKTYIGRTNKKGRKLSISFLLNSIRHFKDGSVNIRNFYERKVIGKSKGKVRMAIMRKMFVAMYYMLRDKKYYNNYNKESHEVKILKFKRMVENHEKLNKAA